MTEGPNIYTSIWVSVYSAYIVAQCAEEWRRTGNAGAIVGNEDRFAEEAATVAELAVEAERRRRAAMFGPMAKSITIEDADAPGGPIITNKQAHAAIESQTRRTPPTGRAAIIAQGEGPPGG